VMAPEPLLCGIRTSGEAFLFPSHCVLPIALASRHGIRAPPQVHA
jgi:hypothetical protein